MFASKHLDPLLYTIDADNKTIVDIGMGNDQQR